MSIVTLVGGCNDGKKIESRGSPRIEIPIPMYMDHSQAIEKNSTAVTFKKPPTEIYIAERIRCDEGDIHICRLESIPLLRALTMILDTYKGFPGEAKSCYLEKHLPWTPMSKHELDIRYEQV